MLAFSSFGACNFSDTARWLRYQLGSTVADEHVSHKFETSLVLVDQQSLAAESQRRKPCVSRFDQVEWFALNADSPLTPRPHNLLAVASTNYQDEGEKVTFKTADAGATVAASKLERGTTGGVDVASKVVANSLASMVS
jgi:hypothetical protein